MFRKKIFKIFIIFLIFIITIEVFSLTVTKLKVLPYYALNKPTFEFFKDNFFIKIESGNWHKGNYKIKDSQECFDVIYETNDVGARDNKNYQDIAKNNKNILLIGDSFAEGYSLNIKDTFHINFEKKINKNILNFGVSGSGPLNYFLMIDNINENYKYSELIYFFNPGNDFIDNNENFKFFKSDKNYQIYYNNKSFEHYSNINFNDFIIQQNKFDLLSTIKSFLKSYTYTSNLLLTFKFQFLNYKQNKKIKKTLSQHHNILQNKRIISSGYNVMDNDIYDGAMFYLNKFFEKIPRDIKKTIVIIPNQKDLADLYNNEKLFNNDYWYKDLLIITKKYNINVIDYLNYFKKNDTITSLNYKSLFHDCDIHYNKKGMKIFTEYVYELY